MLVLFLPLGSNIDIKVVNPGLRGTVEYLKSMGAYTRHEQAKGPAKSKACHTGHEHFPGAGFHQALDLEKEFSEEGY